MNDYLARTDAFMASLGVETYRVGGSVRDELLGRRVKDADYMVRNCSLDTLAQRLRDVDKEAGVSSLKLRNGRQVGWRVSKKGLGLIEIALPRTEVSTGPGRQDFRIIIDPQLSLDADAKRRDFTFNALYRPVDERYLLGGESAAAANVVDPTGRGLYDLEHKFICTTHPDSFRDDPLRTLRALRFVSTLGYDLATNTEAEMRLHATAVTGLTQKGVSGTVLDELSKLLMGDDPAKALRLARDTGVLATLLPELADMIGFDQGSKYHDLTTDEHTFKALETAAHVDAPLRVRMALLFHDAGKPESAWFDPKDGRLHYYKPADNHPVVGGYPELFEDHEVVSERLWREAATRLNVPKALRQDVSTLVLNHMVNVVGSIKPAKVRRARVRFGDALLRDLYLHRMCDLSGKSKASTEYMKKIGVLEQIRETAEAENVPCSVKDLEIRGEDLKSLGAEGREIGRVLNAVLDEVAVSPKALMLTREWQLDRAERLLREAKK